MDVWVEGLDGDGKGGKFGTHPLDIWMRCAFGLMVAGADGSPTVACPAGTSVLVAGDDGLSGGEVFDAGDFEFVILVEADDN